MNQAQTKYVINWTLNDSHITDSFPLDAKDENEVAEKIDRGEIKKPWPYINGYEIRVKYVY